MVLQIAFRYVLNAPLVWTEEAARYLYIWACYLGAAVALRRGSHIVFSDVPDSAFYHDFAQFLVDNGIMAGCVPGLFCGEQTATRGQTAVFLKKLFDTFGKRALAGGGTTHLSNLFMTDIAIFDTSVSVRWETDYNVLLTGTTEAWVLCAPV